MTRATNPSKLQVESGSESNVRFAVVLLAVDQASLRCCDRITSRSSIATVGDGVILLQG
jgi:hypothetical protein